MNITLSYIKISICLVSCVALAHKPLMAKSSAQSSTPVPCIGPVSDAHAEASLVEGDGALVVLAKFMQSKPNWSKKITESAIGSNATSDPTIDVAQVLAQLDKAYQNAVDAMHQCENDAFVQFKYVDAKGKLALARSALTRSLTAVLARGGLSSDAMQRFEVLKNTLEEAYGLFTYEN